MIQLKKRDDESVTLNTLLLSQCSEFIAWQVNFPEMRVCMYLITVTKLSRFTDAMSNYLTVPKRYRTLML